MKLREAAQQALEALEVWRDCLTDPRAKPGWRFAVVGEKAMNALRAALAEDHSADADETADDTPEQRMLRKKWFGGRLYGHLPFLEAVDETMKSLYAELDEAQGTWNMLKGPDVPETNFGNMAQAVDCYGDGNVYRGQRSSDSKIPTLTINGMPAVEGPLSKAQRTGQESPQVEPVAFIHKNFERRIREVLTEADFGGDKLAFLKYCMSDGNLLPLYTAPPMSEPLSFAGVKITEVRLPENIAMRFDDDVLVIERAHGIGGEE